MRVLLWTRKVTRSHMLSYGGISHLWHHISGSERAPTHTTEKVVIVHLRRTHNHTQADSVSGCMRHVTCWVKSQNGLCIWVCRWMHAYREICFRLLSLSFLVGFRGSELRTIKSPQHKVIQQSGGRGKQEDKRLGETKRLQNWGGNKGRQRKVINLKEKSTCTCIINESNPYHTS